jgi:hypothetical protein
MAAAIEVRVGGRGVAAGEEIRLDASVEARCDLCAQAFDAVVSMGGPGGPAVFACAECIRERLGAMSIARWRLKDEHKTPWGKISG